MGIDYGLYQKPNNAYRLNERSMHRQRLNSSAKQFNMLSGEQNVETVRTMGL